MNPQKTLKLSVLPKSEEDLECPKGADFYSLYWDDTPPDVRCFCCWGGCGASRAVIGWQQAVQLLASCSKQTLI